MNRQLGYLNPVAVVLSGVSQQNLLDSFADVYKVVWGALCPKNERELRLYVGTVQNVSNLTDNFKAYVTKVIKPRLLRNYPDLLKDQIGEYAYNSAVSNVGWHLYGLASGKHRDGFPTPFKEGTEPELFATVDRHKAYNHAQNSIVLSDDIIVYVEDLAPEFKHCNGLSFFKARGEWKVIGSRVVGERGTAVYQDVSEGDLIAEFLIDQDGDDVVRNWFSTPLDVYLTSDDFDQVPAYVLPKRLVIPDGLNVEDITHTIGHRAGAHLGVVMWNGFDIDAA